jgi:hypothetical protein
MLPIRNDLKQGDALSPLLFNFALECAIRRVQVIQDGVKIMVHISFWLMVGGSVHTIMENTEVLVAASKETGP